MSLLRNSSPAPPPLCLSLQRKRKNWRESDGPSEKKVNRKEKKRFTEREKGKKMRSVCVNLVDDYPLLCRGQLQALCG